jgi:hypothetical protein
MPLACFAQALIVLGAAYLFVYPSFARRRSGVRSPRLGLRAASLRHLDIVSRRFVEMTSRPGVRVKLTVI